LRRVRSCWWASASLPQAMFAWCSSAERVAPCSWVQAGSGPKVQAHDRGAAPSESRSSSKREAAPKGILKHPSNDGRTPRAWSKDGTDAGAELEGLPVAADRRLRKDLGKTMSFSKDNPFARPRAQRSSVLADARGVVDLATHSARVCAACARGDFVEVSGLLDRATSDLGCSPVRLMRDNMDRGPLHFACASGNLTLVRLLCGPPHSADPQALTIDGHSPVTIAACGGHLGVVRFLAEEHRALAAPTSPETWAAWDALLPEGGAAVAMEPDFSQCAPRGSKDLPGLRSSSKGSSSGSKRSAGPAVLGDEDAARARERAARRREVRAWVLEWCRRPSKATCAKAGPVGADGEVADSWRSLHTTSTADTLSSAHLRRR